MVLAGLLKKLEVKPTDDEYEKIETTRWGNRDVYPIPHDKRVYGVYAFASYWGKVPFYFHAIDISVREEWERERERERRAHAQLILILMN
jgi:hypothetical protein